MTENLVFFIVMAERGDFITKGFEKIKTPEEYQWEEFRNAVSMFPESKREVLEKAFSGKKLSKQETTLLNQCREEWWLESYGFPYNMKKERRMLMRKKHMPSQEQFEAKKLQEDLLSAYKTKDEEKITTLRKTYEQRYPDQLEGVMALLDFIPFLETEKSLDALRSVETGFTEKIGVLLEELTRYQFLLTDFIAANSEDKEFLTLFWDTLEQLAKDTDNFRAFLKNRRGIMGQVAAMKIFEAIGEHPKLSHPKEDAFRAIDGWIDTDRVLQVKAYQNTTPALLETDSVSFPGIIVERNQEVAYANSHLAAEMNKFQMKVSRYKEILGKDLKGYLMVVPFGSFDFITGEPNKEVVEFFKEKFGK